MTQAKIADVPCPRCGCFLSKPFACNCGEIHGDWCMNCGRLASLNALENVRLTPVDARCDAGPVMHTHPFEEKEKRMTAVQELIRQEVEKAGAKTYEEVKAIVDRVYGFEEG